MDRSITLPVPDRADHSAPSPTVITDLSSCTNNESLLEYSIYLPPIILDDSHNNFPPYFNNLSHVASIHDSDPDYSHISTPYSAVNFRLFLERCGLLDRYPELCWKLAHGFPLGKDLSPLLESYCPPNLPSAMFHADVIREYIADELKLGRFAGPFTREELESKIGFFRSSPVQVAVKAGAPGEPDKYRCCRNLSYKGRLDHSVNDEIDSSLYPTNWGRAEDVAKIVRSPSPSPLPSFLFSSLFFPPLFLCFLR